MAMQRFNRWIIASVIVVVATIGCSRDPNVRKKEYFESGARFYKQEKYREAAVQYQNALQLDPRYAEAHYQLGLCYIKLGIWGGVYKEFQRTIELQPDHI